MNGKKEEKLGWKEERRIIIHCNNFFFVRALAPVPRAFTARPSCVLSIYCDSKETARKISVCIVAGGFV